MKTTLRLVCVAALSLGTALAGDQNTNQPATPKPSRQPSKAAKQPVAKPPVAKRTLRQTTGTHLYRTVDLSGQITDGPSQLIIIDSEAIKRSGRSTVLQVLRAQGTGR